MLFASNLACIQSCRTRRKKRFFFHLALRGRWTLVSGQVRLAVFGQVRQAVAGQIMLTEFTSTFVRFVLPLEIRVDNGCRGGREGVMAAIRH